ncbi:NADAR family protein [Stenotrophomonas indicatrix]|uniref:NADAR family protein n=1 Tax=Stenotrophomonas indicatrix TaxID=2045451 RepID=UPI002898375B|nr:NADAR family protein [Stenotrophomonas indicatrix]
MPTKVGTYRISAARYPVPMNDDSRFLHDLQRRQADGEHLRYLCFWGHQPPRMGVAASCFSQWYDAGFNIDGVHYRTAEHYMMAGKARLFGDTKILDQILASATPESAKALGRRIEDFDDAQWTQARYALVVEGNRAKFSQNAALGDFLRATADQVLVEASPVDFIWGIGLAKDHADAHNPARWRGLNLLGFALMDVRNTM